MNDGLHRVVILISGNVQGVFFRTNAKAEAQKLGVRGFVENLPSGHVRIIAEEKRKALEQFIVWCQKGPSFASVRDITVEWRKAEGLFTGFEIR